MKWWLSAPLTILWIVMLGDMIAAMIAARRCFQKRKQAQIAWPMMVLLLTLAAESMNQIVNGVIHAGEITTPTSYVVQWVAGRTIKAIGTWRLALKLMDD